MARGVAVVLAVAIAGAAAGCGDPPLASSIQSFCGGLCAGAAQCNPGLPQTACVSACISDPQNQDLSTVRREVAAAFGSCMARVDCAVGIDAAFDPCWDQARAEVPPTAHLLAFCPDFSAWNFECGSWFSVEDCQDLLNLRTDEFLDLVAFCTRKPTCAEAEACLDTQFGNN